jgi:phage nucleotide-binding protein
MTDLSTLSEPLTQTKLGGLNVQSVLERETFVNILIYGEPGVGKTVLAGSASAVPEMGKCVVIDVEGGTMSLGKLYPGVEVVRIKNMRDMQAVYSELYDMKHGYGTVILDSVTEIQKFSMLQIMKELLQTDATRDPEVPGLREWGKNGEQTRRIVRGFRDLPMNTVMTALARNDKDPRTGMNKVSPSLSGKLSAEVSGFLDIVGYLYTKTVKDEGENRLARLLLTATTDTYVAKDRTGNLEAVMEEPTMSAISQAVWSKP